MIILQRMLLMYII